MWKNTFLDIRAGRVKKIKQRAIQANYQEDWWDRW